MSDDNADKNVVFLAFSNPEAPAERALTLAACGNCRNKTFVVIHDEKAFPLLRCAACSKRIGRMGWAPED